MSRLRAYRTMTQRPATVGAIFLAIAIPATLAAMTLLERIGL